MPFSKGVISVEVFSRRKQFKFLLQLINCFWEDYNNKPSETFFGDRCSMNLHASAGCRKRLNDLLPKASILLWHASGDGQVLST